MIVAEYQITRIAEPEDEVIDQWQIHLLLMPTWVERTFLGKIFPERRTLIGSGSTWHWHDGTFADYFWRFWALKAVQKQINNSGGTKYVNSRFNRSQNK